VVVDGDVVIATGAEALATVGHSKESGSVGRAGVLKVDVTGVYAVDGTLVFATATKSLEGDDETAGAVAAGVILCPLFLLAEGGEAEMAPSTQVRAIVGADADITLSGFTAPPGARADAPR